MASRTAAQCRSAYRASLSKQAKRTKQLREHPMKVCVDPGHGMSNRKANVFDSGCTHTEDGFLFREADIVLKYGLSLKDVLRARGIDVFMTRDDNTDQAPVGMRASNAKNAGCDRYVSIHVNDADSDDANGFEVLFGKSA